MNYLFIEMKKVSNFCKLSIVFKIRLIVLVFLMGAIILTVNSNYFFGDTNISLIKENLDLNVKIQNMTSEIAMLKKKIESSESKVAEPKLEYEKHRRRVIVNIQSFWEYFKVQTSNLKTTFPSMSKQIMNLYNLTYEYKLFWLSDLETMSRNDGFDEWRRYASNSLSNIIQTRLSALQNPQNCSRNKVMQCDAYEVCGWGCHIHRIADCFNIAHYLDRTMIFDDHMFKYTPTGVKEILQPFSKSCFKTNETLAFWPKESDSNNTLWVTGESRWQNYYYPTKFVPAELYPYLEKITNEPGAWWFGQLIKFGIKYNPEILDKVNLVSQEIFTGDPIVGVQIRRTDKLMSEAKLVSIEKYMQSVEEYFDQLGLTRTIKKRRIYLASEDPKVLQEIKTNYPQYEIITNEKRAKAAEHTEDRYTLSSLTGFITDIEVLSNCDYVVCTFSSNICRLILEVFQTKHVDASNRVKNLDSQYSMEFQQLQNGIALRDHKPVDETEIEIKEGDDVVVDPGIDMNGQYIVKNNRTSEKGLVPGFKIEILTETYQSKVNFDVSSV